RGPVSTRERGRDRRPGKGPRSPPRAPSNRSAAMSRFPTMSTRQFFTQVAPSRLRETRMLGLYGLACLLASLLMCGIAALLPPPPLCAFAGVVAGFWGVGSCRGLVSGAVVGGLVCLALVVAAIYLLVDSTRYQVNWEVVLSLKGLGFLGLILGIGAALGILL